MLEYKCEDHYGDGLVSVFVQDLADAWKWDFLAIVPKDGWRKAAETLVEIRGSLGYILEWEKEIVARGLACDISALP
jgi:hypothetical protein